MSNDTQESIINDEFEALKQRANLMGIKFHPNISLEKLRAKIDEAISTEDGETSDKPKAAPTEKTKSAKHAALELVRVRVTNMDQTKSSQQGVIITAGNNKIGTVKKYIPFDVEWHVPRIIYNILKEKKHQIFSVRKDAKGNEITESKLVNAYSIEVLPNLTAAEIKDLAQRQAMANGTN